MIQPEPMLRFIFVFCFFSSSLFAANYQLQSRFTGPVRLKVWKHWQASWNVDLDLSASPEFILSRGFLEKDDGTKTPVIRLEMLMLDEGGLRVRFTGEAFHRAGEYETRRGPIASVEATGIVQPMSTVFEVEAPEFVDESGKRIVTEIQFELLRGDQRLYHYRLLPMYVRGAVNHYWENQIDPYSAHAGSGKNSVANGSSGETGLDIWDGQLVKPTLEFIDRNTLSAGSRIGLHRHERNQEMWLIEKGQAWIYNGVASRTSENYQAPRIQNSKAELAEVAQFDAGGGWIEQRLLSEGEYSVIVPTPNDAMKVCFHGLRAAAEETKTFTMGTKN